MNASGETGSDAAMTIVVALAASVGVGLATYRTVEAPMTRWLRRKVAASVGA